MKKNTYNDFAPPEPLTMGHLEHDIDPKKDRILVVYFLYFYQTCNFWSQAIYLFAWPIWSSRIFWNQVLKSGLEHKH